MILAFDTETTSLPLWKEPSDHPDQPHLVQLAMLLIDPETRKERASFNMIIKPGDWTIPEDVIKIHGISNEIASKCGISENIATSIFMSLRQQSTLIIGHNISFDERIMRIAMLRLGIPKESLDALKPITTFCTMKKSEKIVNLPPTEKMEAAGFTKPKAPKLSEAYSHFFNEELIGAHDALIDIRACARLYWHLQDMKEEAAA